MERAEGRAGECESTGECVWDHVAQVLLSKGRWGCLRVTKTRDEESESNSLAEGDINMEIKTNRFWVLRCFTSKWNRLDKYV